MATLLKFLLLVNLFYGLSTAQLIANSKQDIVKTMARITTSCYADHNIILIRDNSTKDFLNTFAPLRKFSWTLFDSSSAISTPIGLEKKIPLLIAATNSSTRLHHHLAALKTSRWWNIMAPFFILDFTASNCTNVRNVLNTAWEMNVVNAFVLCRELEHQVIYTYNPYTNRAAESWKEIQTPQPDRWTLYRWKNLKGIKFCRDLNFDKAKYLDGAVIKVAVPEMSKGRNDPLVSYGDGKTGLYNVRFLQMLDSALNAKIEVQYIGEDFPKADQIGKCHLPLFNNASSDVAMCWRTYLLVYGLPVTYPVAHMDYSIVTKHLGFYTPLEKIQNFYGIVTLVSLIIILAMTFFVVIMSDEKRRCSFAGFEALRLLINTGLFIKMNSLSRRIFFAVIFLYFLIIHATFSGNISSFLTKDVERKNVEILNDLSNPRITTVFTTSSMLSQIMDPEVKKKTVIESFGFACAERAVHNESIACMYPSFYIVAEVRKHNSEDVLPKLHVTTKFIGRTPFVFAVRHDWPLMERFNKVLMSLESSGVLGKWSREISSKADDKYKRQVATSEVHIRKISLNMLQFAFNFWAAGLFCSTLVFILERSQNVTIRRRL